MFYRFECQTFATTRCRFHNKKKQEVDYALLRGLLIIDNWPLKDIFTEIKLKKFPFSINYQVRLQNAIQSGRAIQVKFH